MSSLAKVYQHPQLHFRGEKDLLNKRTFFFMGWSYNRINSVY